MAVDTGSFAVPAGAAQRRSLRRGLGTLVEPSLSTAGGVALTVMTLLAGALVLVAAQHATFLTPPALPRYFPGWMAGPLHGLWDGAPSSHNQLMALGSWALVVMYVCYLVVLACAGRMRAHWIFGAIVALHLVFLLAPPLPYTDVFNYLNYGRMGVLHGLNPYTSAVVIEPHSDPTYALSNWHHLTSPYGPLFILFTYALVPLGVPASFWVLKVVLGAASLGTLWLLARIARMLGRDPVRVVAFVGLNPLVLVWGLGGDHNDFLMVFFLVLAVYLVLRGRDAADRVAVRGVGALIARLGSAEFAAGAALVAAAAIKASAAVLIPFLIIAAKRRRGILAGLAAAALVLGCASLIAFGAHLPDLRTQGRLVTAIGLPNLLGLALGQGGETDTMRAIVAIALAAALAVCVRWAWRRPADWVRAATFAVLALVVTLTWIVPWYVLWVLPLAALWRGAKMRVALLILGAYLLLAFIPSSGRVLDALHFNPGGTSLGQQHSNDIYAILR